MLLECYCRGVYGLRLRSSIFCVYSKIFRDIPLVGPNAISKKSNNVVISSPRVFIFSGILVPKDSFPHIWSGDLEPLPVWPPGGAQFFFKVDFLGNRSSNLKSGFKVFGVGHFLEFAPLGGFCPPPDPCRFWS